jgi:signal transduction histidine kinase
MFQEMLTNVARHAKATRIDVGIALPAKAMVLTVRDNGRGVPASGKARHGYGLLGMRERTLLLGGELKILVGKPRGTTVEVTIPLANRRRSPRTQQGTKAHD